jgi:O-antigen/teichoic acid export membrane protein
MSTILYLDRLAILGLISTSALTYYATPYVLVDTLRTFPVALMGAAFPAFAASHRHDPARTVRLFERTLGAVFVVLFPIALLLVVFSREILTLWLGAEFAQVSAVLMRLITVSVFLSCLGRVPFALLQGVGRADLTAKLHLVALPTYAVLLVWLTRAYGPIGVAACTSIRALVHLVALLALSRRVMPPPAGTSSPA